MAIIRLIISSFCLLQEILLMSQTFPRRHSFNCRWPSKKRLWHAKISIVRGQGVVSVWVRVEGWFKDKRLTLALYNASLMEKKKEGRRRKTSLIGPFDQKRSAPRSNISSIPAAAEAPGFGHVLEARHLLDVIMSPDRINKHQRDDWWRPRAARAIPFMIHL